LNWQHMQAQVSGTQATGARFPGILDLVPVEDGGLEVPGPFALPVRSQKKESHMLMTLLIVILVLALIGALPRWPHSRNWGYYPSGGLGLVLVILVILILVR
jgi:hypothetical protein